MAVTEPLYTKEDFKQAVSALLPPGQYWQYEQGDQLDGLLAGLASEFKTIHDETKINPLYQEDNAESGWKLADYQRILNDNAMAGTVFDDSSTPNLIYINFEAGEIAGDFMKILDNYRLPHSAFCCTYTHQQTLCIAVCRQSLTINRRELRTV